MPNRAKHFNGLANQAAGCQVCPDLADQSAVLSSGTGSLTAQVVFVAEAPGRFGAGRTGIPFSGDQSGKNFEILLHHAGWTRNEVFITNAALCNPLENGNNRRPTAAEIRNCSHYLESVLNIIQPKIVVTLGGVGLQAINILLGTKYQLGKTVARPITTPEFILMPLYHPSPRVTHWRRTLPRQKRDFKKIVEILKSLQSA
jgi:uracil-DNA glycosylase family 4